MENWFNHQPSPRKPWLRKQRAKQNKETRMKKREEQQMRLLVFGMGLVEMPKCP